jgi:hypothetical protein
MHSGAASAGWYWCRKPIFCAVVSRPVRSLILVFSGRPGLRNGRLGSQLAALAPDAAVPARAGARAGSVPSSRAAPARAAHSLDVLDPTGFDVLGFDVLGFDVLGTAGPPNRFEPDLL